MRNGCMFIAFLAILAVSNSLQAQQTSPPQVAPSNVAAASPSPDKDGFYQRAPGIAEPVLIRPMAVTGLSGLHDLLNKCASRTVVISAVIDTDGAAGVREAQQAADSTCESAVIDAIKRSRFEAGTLNGEPVPVLICLGVTFLEDARKILPSIQPCPETLSAMTFEGQSVYSAGGAVKAPVATYQPMAEFSEDALRHKYQGICLIGLIVDALGNPQNVRVVRALGMGLDEKALEAVRRYRFKPAMLNGRPVPVRVTIEIDFRLYQRP